MYITVDDRTQKKKIEFFNNLNLNLRYDSVGSTFSFSMYFNPENPDHVFLVGVSEYKVIRIYENDNLLLTGFILSNSFSGKSTNELVSISGYSICGVLEDSNIALSSYPLQSDNLTLREITTKLLRPFQIKFVVDDSVSSEMDIPFATTTAEPTDTVKDYICSLATQLNIIVSHNEKGYLLFTKAKTNNLPIFTFENDILGIDANLSFNGQGMHSPINVIRQQDTEGGNAGQFTLNNPYVPSFTTAFRPKTVIQNSGDNVSTELACKAVLADELKNIQLSINIDNWYIGDKFIMPNTTIDIIKPSIALRKKTRFFVESVSYKSDNEGKTATLNCVLPEVYNGETPVNIFL